MIDFLNNRSLIVTCFGQLHDSVLLAKDAFLSGVWSKFITKDNWVEDWQFDVEISILSLFLSILVFPFGSGAFSFCKTQASEYTFSLI